MKIGEKIYKWISYGFIVFIVTLIVLTFGMPSFIGSAADSKRYLAAKIGEEVITRKEVQNMKAYLARLPQFQNFASQDSFLNKYALDYLVSEKLEIVMQKDGGIYPLGDARSTIVAKYLKENFKEYQNNAGFDFARFDKEFLKPRRINFSTIEDQAVRSMVYEVKQMMNNFEVVSKKEIEDESNFKNTKISYQILVFTPDGKKNTLKKLIGITDIMIFDKFKKDYLSKDKNDKLTDLKKEAITQAIINEKRASVEKKFISTLNEDVKKLTLPQIQQKFGGIFLNVNNVAISESLSQAAKNNKANLNLLENSQEFLNTISEKNLNKVQGPLNISDNLFLVNVTNISRALNKDTGKSEIEEGIKNENKSAIYQLIDDISKSNTKIVKYSAAE